MRAISLLAILLFVMVSYTSGGPPTQINVSFALPFTAIWANLGGACPDWADRIALGDSFDSGLKVAIVSKWGVCNAKTVRKFRYAEPGYEGSGSQGFEATVLEGTEECPIGGGDIALIGVNPVAVRLVTPRKSTSSLPKRVELKARRLLTPDYETVGERLPISDPPPKVMSVGRVTLVLFPLASGSPSQQSNVFFSVVIVNGRIFPLEGRCTEGHIFFTVNRRLHVAYWNYACGCAIRVMTVYDLSHGTPKLVHEMGDLFDIDD